MSPSSVASGLHEHEVQVTFADLDWQGHTNNASYVRWLQEAHFHLLDPDRSKLFWPHEDTFVVGSHAVDYCAPLRYRPTPVTVSTLVRELRTSRVTLESTIHDDYRIYARDRSMYVAFSLREGAPRPLTEVERSYLRRYEVPAEHA